MLDELAKIQICEARDLNYQMNFETYKTLFKQIFNQSYYQLRLTIYYDMFNRLYYYLLYVCNPEIHLYLKDFLFNQVSSVVEEIIIYYLKTFLYPRLFDAILHDLNSFLYIPMDQLHVLQMNHFISRITYSLMFSLVFQLTYEILNQFIDTVIGLLHFEFENLSATRFDLIRFDHRYIQRELRFVSSILRVSKCYIDCTIYYN